MSCLLDVCLQISSYMLLLTSPVAWMVSRFIDILFLFNVVILHLHPWRAHSRNGHGWSTYLCHYYLLEYPNHSLRTCNHDTQQGDFPELSNWGEFDHHSHVSSQTCSTCPSRRPAESTHLVFLFLFFGLFSIHL